VKIEIQNDAVTTRAGVSAAGKNYSIRNQEAWFHQVGVPYPTRIELSLDNNQAPWSVGEYSLDEKSFFVDKYRRLSVGRLKLIPISKAKAA
jgi:hypothetical protein